MPSACVLAPLLSPAVPVPSGITHFRGLGVFLYINQDTWKFICLICLSHLATHVDLQFFCLEDPWTVLLLDRRHRKVWVWEAVCPVLAQPERGCQSCISITSLSVPISTRRLASVCLTSPSRREFGATLSYLDA